MPLPSKIHIQLIDKMGNPRSTGNILFGLKIFISENSWHNYSFFKTDPRGYVSLTKKDIIDNAELKWKGESIHNESTKYKLYARDGKQIAEMIETIRQLLLLYDNMDFITEDLKRRKVPDEKIPDAIAIIKNKADEDKALYEF